MNGRIDEINLIAKKLDFLKDKIERTREETERLKSQVEFFNEEKTKLNSKYISITEELQFNKETFKVKREEYLKNHSEIDTKEIKIDMNQEFDKETLIRELQNKTNDFKTSIEYLGISNEEETIAIYNQMEIYLNGTYEKIFNIVPTSKIIPNKVDHIDFKCFWAILVESGVNIDTMLLRHQTFRLCHGLTFKNIFDYLTIFWKLQDIKFEYDLLIVDQNRNIIKITENELSLILEDYVKSQGKFKSLIFILAQKTQDVNFNSYYKEYLKSDKTNSQTELVLKKNEIYESTKTFLNSFPKVSNLITNQFIKEKEILSNNLNSENKKEDNREISKVFNTLSKFGEIIFLICLVVLLVIDVIGMTGIVNFSAIYDNRFMNTYSNVMSGLTDLNDTDISSFVNQYVNLKNSKSYMIFQPLIMKLFYLTPLSCSSKEQYDEIPYISSNSAMSDESRYSSCYPYRLDHHTFILINSTYLNDIGPERLKVNDSQYYLQVLKNLVSSESVDIQGSSYFNMHTYHDYSLRVNILQANYLSSRQSELQTILSLMKSFNNKDPGLRGLSIEFNIYNFVTKFWKNVKIIYEYNTGGANKDPIIYVNEFLLDMYAFGIKYKIIDVIRIILYILIIIKLFYNYFKIVVYDKFMSIKEKLLLLISYDYIFLLLISCLGLSSVIYKFSTLRESVDSANHTKYASDGVNPNFFHNIDIVNTNQGIYNIVVKLQTLEIILVLWMTFNQLKFIFRKLSKFYDFIIKSFGNVFIVFIIVLFLLIPMAFMGMILFGKENNEYSDFFESFIKVLISVFGYIKYPSSTNDNESNNRIAFLMFLLYFVFHLILASLVIVYATESERVNILINGHTFDEKVISNNIDDGGDVIKEVIENKEK